jgi:hypothetical protein
VRLGLCWDSWGCCGRPPSTQHRATLPPSLRRRRRTRRSDVADQARLTELVLQLRCTGLIHCAGFYAWWARDVSQYDRVNVQVGSGSGPRYTPVASGACFSQAAGRPASRLREQLERDATAAFPPPPPPAAGHPGGDGGCAGGRGGASGARQHHPGLRLAAGFRQRRRAAAAGHAARWVRAVRRSSRCRALPVPAAQRAGSLPRLCCCRRPARAGAALAAPATRPRPLRPARPPPAAGPTASEYARSKAAGDALVAQMAAERGLPACTCKLACCVGADPKLTDPAADVMRIADLIEGRVGVWRWWWRRWWW